jgi:glycosyltransferase involved in cell wall biosynthesis
MSRHLKILQSGSSFFEWGGLEIFLLNYCEALLKQGHDVTLTCPPDTFVDTEARKRGIRTVAISNKRGQYPQAFLAYGKLLKKERFDVVHTHIDKTFRSALVAAWLMGVRKRVHTFYTPDVIKASRLSFLYNTAATDLFAVSEDTRLRQIQHGVPDDKIRVIPNAIDAIAFRAGVDLKQVEAYQTAWCGESNLPIIGFAGRVVGQKGWSDFIEAIALVPEVRGVVIGDGYDKEKLLARIEACGISERVTFAGFIKDMPSALATLDIFVLPSIYPEPLSTVVLQAMALELPVIGTRLGGTPEMIEDGKTGLLVPPHAPMEIADAIKALLADPTKRQEMGNAGRKHVETVFSMETMIDAFEEIYQARH